MHISIRFTQMYSIFANPYLNQGSSSKAKKGRKVIESEDEGDATDASVEVLSSAGEASLIIHYDLSSLTHPVKFRTEMRTRRS